MRIIDRYITRTIILTFLATMAMFSLLFALVDSANHLEDVLRHGVTLKIMLQYYWAYSPIIFVQTASIACLISCLLTYAHLNSHNEVVALRASGFNFWKLTRPALTFALLISSLILLLNEKFVPQAEETSRRIRTMDIQHAATDPNRKLRPAIQNLTFYGLKNRLYYIDSFDPNTGEISGITIIGYDNELNVEEKILALKGVWTGIAWKFYQCHVTIISRDPQVPTKVKVYAEKLMDMKETPQDLLTQGLNVNSMNIVQLQEYIRKFSTSGAARAVNNLRVDLHQKIVLPFANFVIVLVGLPFVLMVGRRKAQSFTALGIAMTTGFFYYVFNAVGLALGKGGLFSPILAAWLAPIIFIGIATYVIQEKF